MVTKASLCRAAVLAALAGTGFLAASADPAAALCRYGSPNCVNPNPGPKLPSVNTTRIPESNWVDPDCRYYGNCRSPNSARTVPGAGKGQPLPPRVQTSGRFQGRR